MKTIEVTFKTKTGIETVKRINTSGTKSSAVRALSNQFPSWKVIKSEVTKEFVSGYTW